MKKIVDILTKKEVEITKEDLPIFIHGKEHSGASLFSITVASHLHQNGSKLCIFTAYPMAKEEFLKQIKDVNTVFYIKKETDIKQSSKFQTIIVQSGNISLFLKVISNPAIIDDRIIFVKNIETINVEIYNLVTQHLFIVSGNLELNPLQYNFKNFKYNTKIFFNPIIHEKVPILEKYQAFIKNKMNDKIITLK